MPAGFHGRPVLAAIPAGIELLVGGIELLVGALRLVRGIQSLADGERLMAGNSEPVELPDLAGQAFAGALEFTIPTPVQRPARMLGKRRLKECHARACARAESN